MEALEAEADRRGLHLLVLDTAVGHGAEELYVGLGYQRLGVVPQYARTPDGKLHSTAFFYKELRHVV